MDQGRWQRLEALFERALPLDEAGRRGLLDRECAGDGELRRQVEALLAEDAQAPDEFQVRVAPEPPAIAPRIEGHELLRRVGHGGMGEVWEARQLRPERRVAIKVVRAGLDTAAILARFERERQALALMEHSSIARFFEVGLTGDGRPFFSMEFLDGPPITRYCEERGLPVAQRLALFRRVCSAVDHAHRKTVLHRDLKPSNILVVEEDGQPVPKVIDFGVAKALGESTPLETLYTEAGLLVGTPEYMSPEQVRGEACDLRSDVYSLGMVLFELLAGTRPFDDATLREGGLETMLRRLREDDIPRPSTLPGSRLTARGDLDWITLKALEKDPERRYASARELSEDIGRHLAFEPVEARPPSVGYQWSRFVRRHRAGVAVAGVAVLALLALAATMTVQAGRLARERDRTAQQAAVANARAEFMEELFRNVDPDRMRGEEVSALDLLRGGVGRIEAELDDQPELQSRLLYSVGKVYRELGDYDEAARLLSRTLELSEAALGPGDRQTVSCASSLALVHDARGDHAAAEPLHLRAIEGLSALLGHDHQSTLRARGNYAASLLHRGAAGPAARLYEEVLEGRTRTLGPDHKDTLYAIADLARARHQLGHSREAVGELEAVIPRIEATVGADHPNSPGTKVVLARIHEDLGEHDRALQWYREAMPVLRRVLGPEHARVREAEAGLRRCEATLAAGR